MTSLPDEVNGPANPNGPGDLDNHTRSFFGDHIHTEWDSSSKCVLACRTLEYLPKHAL